MTKQEIITEVAIRTGRSEYDVRFIFEECIDTMTQSLRNLEDVTLRGFGGFKIIERSARLGRNINTGEPVHIGARKAVVFEPGKELKNI